MKGVRYVQVALYSDARSDATAEHKFRVLQSFGRETSEAHYRASLFAAAYNALLDEHVHAYLTNQPDAREAALGVFGWILGASLVQEVLGEDH